MRIKKYNFPFREYADVYLPSYVKKIYQLLGALCCILFVATIYTAFIMLELFLLCLVLLIVCGCTTLCAYLCYRNILLVIKSESGFVYRSMFGNIYEFGFDQIKKIKFGAGGVKIVCLNKSIYIDATAVMSERLQDKIGQVRQQIGNADLFDIPASSRKADILKQTFYRRR